MFSSNLFGFPIANFQNKIYNYYIIKSYVNLSFSLSLPPSTHKYIYIYIEIYIYIYIFICIYTQSLDGVNWSTFSWGNNDARAPYFSLSPSLT